MTQVTLEESTKEEKSNDWQEVIFSDAIEINNYPSVEEDETYKCVSMSDLGKNKRKIEGYEEKEYTYSRPRFENEDTLFARITPCLEQGKTAFVNILDKNEVAFGSTEFIVMSSTEKTDPKFVYYTARRPEIRKFAIKRMTGTSGRQRVPTDIFDNKKIKIPSLPEQKKISSILDALDSKIEVNNRISQILEEIAQTIFKSWFVDFEPYEKFKDSELGEIPKEFEIKKLEDIISLEYGEGLPEREREGSEFPVYGSNGKIGAHKEALVEGPGIIVGRKGTIGTVTLSIDDFWPIDTTFYVEPKVEYDILFYYHLLKESIEFGHLGSDSAVPGLNRNIALDQEIVLPSKEEVEKFVSIVEPFYAEIDNLINENNKLADSRDTLLPKLMSGEIRVIEDASQ